MNFNDSEGMQWCHFLLGMLFESFSRELIIIFELCFLRNKQWKCSCQSCHFFQFTATILRLKVNYEVENWEMNFEVEFKKKPLKSAKQLFNKRAEEKSFFAFWHVFLMAIIFYNKFRFSSDIIGNQLKWHLNSSNIV